MVVVNAKNMYTFKIVLFFYIVGIIYVVESNDPDPITLYEKEVKEDDADRLLSEIPPKDALPMILFKRGPRNKLYLPDKLKNVKLIDGKLINGTQFINEISSDQLFFCPDENNAGNKCLVPKTFDGTERLQCASEPTPVIESGNLNCGKDATSTLYTILYQICENEKIKFGTKEIPFYRICYNKQTQETLFTVHTINSPELLTAKLLVREREIDYHMMEMHEFPILSNRRPDDMDIDEKSTSQYQTTVQGYQWQKLVPFEDMALGLWKKTTFQQTNLALQHEQLISLWDEISEYVRSNAIKNFFDDKLKTFVYTGVFRVDSAHEDNNNDQLPNIWVKLIITAISLRADPSGTDERLQKHGLAILMNNFIGTETSRTASLYSEAIDDYCKKDVCVDTLSNKFKSVKGRVRCCLVNKKILGLFNENNRKLKELHIPNVNVTEDQETLKDGLNLHLTDAQSADTRVSESIGEIQPNEILPVILFSNPYNFKLNMPKNIEKLEMKNKRIVNGSGFSYRESEYELPLEFSKWQIYFCPKENSEETCLSPQKFGRFEPLQCTKQATPVVRQLPNTSRSSNKCGINDSGTLYEVVYEICPAEQPYDYQTTEIKFYEFCYDTAKKIILYTHHKIMSTTLLLSKLLFRERDMKYDMITDAILPPELVDASQMVNESDHKLQKLVPSEDMAFASWIRSTYLYVNVASQHESLIPLWNIVNYYVKENASKSWELLTNMKYNHSDDSIYTGVLYKQSSTLNDKSPEIWFKVIHTEKKIRYEHGPEWIPYQEGIVILMNNHIIPKTDKTDFKPSENFDTYCKPNKLCAKKLIKESEKIGGELRCCHLTIEIAQLLGIPIPNLKYGVLGTFS